MSVRVLSEAMMESEAEGAARLVLFVLADSAHDDGVTWIDQDLLAKKAHLSRKYVVECVKKLEQLGEVEIQKVQRGRKRINVYFLREVAAVEIDYERLPFELPETFSPRADEVRNSDLVDDDEVRSTDLTRSDLPPLSRGRAISENLERNEERKKHSGSLSLARLDDTPPKLVKVDGKNLGFDALAEVCGIDSKGNQAGRVVAALNGGRAIKVGIRELCWREVLSRNGGVVAGETFERFVALRIREKAQRYRETMRDAMLTPTSLATWWTDVEKPSAGRALTPEQIASGEWRKVG